MPTKSETGDIHLRPWHTFQRNDCWYLLNVQSLSSRRVDRSLIETIRKLSKNSHLILDPAQRLKLCDLELIEVTDQPVNTAPARNHPQAAFPAKAPPIRTMNLMVAQTCNFDCVYCYGAGGEYGARGMMTEQTALRAMDWLTRQSGDLPMVSVTLFGGEPLLNLPVIRSVVNYGAKKGKTVNKKFEFAIATNGYLLNAALIDYLCENRISVLVGFDGPAHVQDRNRPLASGGDTHDRVIRNVRMLLDKMPDRTSLRATLWDPEDVSTIVDYFYELGAERFQTALAAPCLHRPERTPLNSRAITDERISKLKEISNRFLLAVKEKDFTSASRLKHWLEFRWMADLMGPPRKSGPDCGTGRIMAAVSTEGDIYPCHRFVGMEAFRLGHMEKPDGPDRSLFLGQPLDLREPCRNCWARLFCRGTACLYNNLTQAGDLFTPTQHHCRLIQSAIENAVYVEHEFTEADRNLMDEKAIVSKRGCPMDLF